MRLLSNLLEKFIKKGSLRFYDADGKLHTFGGREPGPAVTARLHDAALEKKLFTNPELYAAEAYMDGKLTFEEGSGVHDFMMLFSVNRSALYSYGSQKVMQKIWRALRRWHQANPIGTAAKNARHHYDVSSELYQLFLDKQMQYSCAYFRDPENETLEQAQQNKLIHATTKLQLKPGMTVAEIGSGWGGFAIHIARETGAHVTAINVSPEQLKVSRERAKEAGVADLIDFRELDYRKLEGKFDRVVSVGMMEHVGIGHFDEYFGQGARAAEGRRLRLHPLHRAHVGARHDGAVHPQIYFPGSLRAGAVGSLRGDRAQRIMGGRQRNPAAALLLYGAALAETLRRQPRGGKAHL